MKLTNSTLTKYYSDKTYSYDLFLFHLIMGFRYAEIMKCRILPRHSLSILNLFPGCDGSRYYCCPLCMNVPLYSITSASSTPSASSSQQSWLNSSGLCIIQEFSWFSILPYPYIIHQLSLCLVEGRCCFNWQLLVFHWHFGTFVVVLGGRVVANVRFSVGVHFFYLNYCRIM